MFISECHKFFTKESLNQINYLFSSGPWQNELTIISVVERRHFKENVILGHKKWQ